MVELTGRPRAEGNVWNDKAGTQLAPTHWGWVSQVLPQHLLYPFPTLVSLGQCEFPDWPLTYKKSSRDFPKVLRQRTSSLSWQARTPSSGSSPNLEPPTSLNCSPHWSPLMAPSLHDPRFMWPLAILFPPVQKMFSSWHFHNPCPPLDPVQLSHLLGSHFWLPWLGTFLLSALEVSWASLHSTYPRGHNTLIWAII